MKKLLVVLIFTLFVFAPRRASALESPITGTFVFPDFVISDQNTMDSFLDEIKAFGMDTVVWTYAGSVYKTGDCSGPYIEDNFFTKNSLNYLENSDKLLTSLKNKNFFVYVGLSGYWRCVNPSSGDPNDANSDQGRVIDFSKRLLLSLKDLCQTKGWDCQGDTFIKGYYIPVEYTLKSFSGFGIFYKNMYSMIKPLDPSKKILISPYTNNTYDPEYYQDAFDAGRVAVLNSYADIIALQDSVGSGKVTTFASDREHFQGLVDGVRSANVQTGKSVEVWGNVETFHNSLNSTLWPPTDIDTLKQQMTTIDDLVNKKITWLYSWSFAILPLLDNYGGVQYTPDFAQRRKNLRAAYVEWLGPFQTVNILNLRKTLSNFTTITDYNLVVGNFGK